MKFSIYGDVRKHHEGKWKEGWIFTEYLTSCDPYPIAEYTPSKERTINQVISNI